MNKIIKLLLLFFLVGLRLSGIDAVAQEIPVGTWRMHISYNAIHSVSFGTEDVYAATDNGVMIMNREEGSIKTLTKINGLSSANITQVASDAARQQILVTYTDGNIDIVRANELINFDKLKTSTTVSGSKKINHITIRNQFAYLSTDFGVVVFDLEKLEVKETYRDLGVNGSSIKIYQSTFLSDSIFLATEKGVLAGDVKDNLMDFNNWKRFNTGVFSGSIQSITTFSNHVFAAISASGIYQYNLGIWELESYLQGKSFKSISGGNSNMLITEDVNVWKVSATGILTQIISTEFTNPLVAHEDNNSKVWIGDDTKGLISDASGSYSAYLPNGPTFTPGFRLYYQNKTATEKELMYLVSGGYNTNGTPAQYDELINYFSNGSWKTQQDLSLQDVTDMEYISSGQIFVAAYGIGLQITQGETETIFNNSNSSLTNNQITALQAVPDWQYHKNRVYITEYGSETPLLYYSKKDNFIYGGPPIAQYPIDVKVDNYGQVWVLNDPAKGGGIEVVDGDTFDSRSLTDVPGSGGLPSRSVYAIEVDREGQVWVGTAAGVAYFPAMNNIVYSDNITAVKPIYENRFLLRDEKVTAIEVDGGNRKWMGTERGAWLFDPYGEELIYNFNTSNSPLPSDKIKDIEVNDATGEVFFITEAGIASFRAEATESTNVFENVKIFPNPVTANFNGVVAISGLATDALVKITDVSGKLVWQTTANGGTATWNVRDYNGNRAATGIYLVLASASNANEVVVGKIAVVN